MLLSRRLWWFVPFYSLFLTSVVSVSQGSRVYELSDKFVELYKQDSRSWLVKFYAPWCHYCRQLEPIYMQVAQQLAREGSDVVVGRLDCTRFTAAATAFPVRGFPTILFVTKDFMIEFDGDRTQEEILDFARRLSGSAVKVIGDCNEVDSLLDLHKVFFVYVGDSVPDYFSKTANKYRSVSWFYHSEVPCPSLESLGSSFVVKGTTDKKLVSRFDEDSLLVSNTSMNHWVRRERFPYFVKITSGNFNHILKSEKVMVIAVVDELVPTPKLASGKQEEFRDLMAAIALTYDDRQPFIFGWSSTMDLINSITLHSVKNLPALVLINSTDMSYSVWDEEILPQEILHLLKNVSSFQHEFSGGNNYWTRFRRMIFDAIVSFVNMYHGNPVLTLLLFGLPLAFLSFIIYSAFFADFMDAPDDDEEEELLDGHPKSE